MSSFQKPALNRGQSATRYPKVMPSIGPMMGDTSIEATINTVIYREVCNIQKAHAYSIIYIPVVLVARPPAAMNDAPIRFNQVLIVILAPLFISLNISSVVLRAFINCATPFTAFNPRALYTSLSVSGSSSRGDKGFVRSGFIKSIDERIIRPTLTPNPFFLRGRENNVRD